MCLVELPGCTEKQHISTAFTARVTSFSRVVVSDDDFKVMVVELFDGFRRTTGTSAGTRAQEPKE